MKNIANNGSDGISRELVAQRAYELWENEGRPEGRSMEHWTRAEEMLRNSERPADSALEAPSRGRKPAVPRTTGRREKNFEVIS